MIYETSWLAIGVFFAFVVLTLALSTYLGRQAKSSAGYFAALPDMRPTLAVVPFATRDAEDDHFVVGEVLADELIRDLSRTAELNVISRLSTTAFRDRVASLADIGAKLGAAYVLSGRYSIAGADIAADVELAEVRTGEVVMSRSARAPLASLLSGPSDLVDEIAAGVCAAIMSRELTRAQAQPLPTLKSYTLLMGAIALMHRGSQWDFDHARRLLEELIERAGRQAVPRAWLAKWYVLRIQQGWSSDPHLDRTVALQCSRQALEADPSCSLALTMDGLVHTHLARNLDVAMARYDEALAANPNDSLTWLLKGTLAAFRGIGSEAVACTQRALRLSPLDPHRYYYESLAASACIADRRWEEAVGYARSSLRHNRNHTSTLRVLAVALRQLGRAEEARGVAGLLMEREPGLTVSGWLARAPSADFEVGREFARTLRELGIPE